MKKVSSITSAISCQQSKNLTKKLGELICSSKYIRLDNVNYPKMFCRCTHEHEKEEIAPLQSCKSQNLTTPEPVESEVATTLKEECAQNQLSNLNMLWIMFLLILILSTTQLMAVAIVFKYMLKKYTTKLGSENLIPLKESDVMVENDMYETVT
jgi:hypothetical protein